MARTICASAVIDESGELAGLICAGQGRPRAEVEVMELLPAIETLQWLADIGPRILAGEKVGRSRALRPLTRALGLRAARRRRRARPRHGAIRDAAR